MKTIKWYQSYTVWSAVVVVLLGLIPLANELLKVVAPAAIIIVDAVLTFLAGTLIIILRVWNTNTVIKAPPPTPPVE
jgi:hypothetical protein